MPITVTVPGVIGSGDPTYSTISLQYQTQQNANIAIQLLGQIYAAAAGKTLQVENDQETPTSFTGSPTLKEFTIGDSGGIQNTGTVEGTVPAGYTGIIDAYTNQVAEIVGAPGQTNETVVGGGDFHFYTNGGSGTVISSAGTVGGGNQVWANPTNDGNWTVFFDGGSNSVFANSGNFFIDDGNASTTGSNLIFLGATGNDTVWSYGTDTIIAAPGGKAFVAAWVPGSVFFGNTGQSIYVNLGGADTFVAAGGSDTVFAAASGGTYFGNSGPLLFVSNPSVTGTLVTGSAPATVFGNTGVDLTLAGTTNGDIVVAATGSETLNAAAQTGNSVFFAGPGADSADSIVAGSGNNTLVAGPGSNTLVGGTGSDLFVFYNHTPGGGADSILGWNSKDFADLSGYGAAGANGLPAGTTMSVVNGSEVLTLPDGTTVTFVGVASVPSSHIVSS